MALKEAKLMLKESPEKIIEILEMIGCYNVGKEYNRIKACRPDGDNTRSVSVKLNNSLSSHIFTDSIFESQLQKDFIGLVMHITKWNFGQTKDWILDYLGIEECENAIKLRKSSLLSVIKKFKTKEDNCDFKREFLDESYLDSMQECIVQEWVDEGISPEIQRLIGVRDNKSYGRWIIPIRDEFERLVTTKGRTYVKDWKLLDLAKYNTFPAIGINDVLFGLYLALPYIKEKNEVIVWEGEKSVMKMFSWNWMNCVGTGKFGLNPHLVKKIKALRVPVVIVGDKDINEEQLIHECKKISHLTDVSYIWDTDGLLSGTMSPCDLGLETWLKLYENRRRVD